MEDDFPDHALIHEWQQYALYLVGQIVPDMALHTLRPLEHPEFEKLFVKYEQHDPMVAKKFPFGIILCKRGQTKESEWFANSKGSVAYDGFLRCIGDVVDLKGWDLNEPYRYSGGLDTSRTVVITDCLSVFSSFR